MKEISFEKVFIIEDDLITCFLIKTLMEKTGFATSVETFHNGEEALVGLEKSGTAPDLIFLDLNMPIMDGWEFLRQMHSRSYLPRVPVYILTSSIDPIDKEESHKHNQVKDYLIKPLSLPDLENIRNSLGIHLKN